MSTASETKPATDFERTLNGMLYSLLSWQQLADFWPKIDPAAGWYLYAIGEPVPQFPASPEQVSTFIQKIDSLLHNDHDEDYCGIVYANDLNNPSLIKIYDPHNLGSSCGSSKNPPLPGWIMSRMPPSYLQPKGIIPGNRKRWWETLMSGSTSSL
jgi:hypothetical protein